MVHQFETQLSYAQALDEQDELKHFRERFHIPQADNGEPAIYMCGNSLGLQPKSAAAAVAHELEQWAQMGVEGHFRGETPWFTYHKAFAEPLAKVVGAKPDEVVAMNVLTVNLHLMLVSFYRPTATRYKIITEAGAFPSDQYALESQVRFHGFDPDAAIVELKPRAGEHTLRTEDILQTIAENADSLALVMMGGINYYTGQVFNMQKITAKAHEVGAVAGFDLAHAAGNVTLALHDWDVDFAVWCSYKYMNAGPGGVSGVFVHERHAENTDLPRFAGWWGHSEKERFQMKKGFKPMYGAAGWQLSNAPVLHMAPYKASLAIFEEAGMSRLTAKSRLLTGYLAFLLGQIEHIKIEIITPEDPAQRGCQLSMIVENGRQVFDYLVSNGVIGDWREPNVIRLSPVPLYNRFEDVYRIYEILTRFKQ
ncbi:kynureninase [Flexibacter flexilis DSM 6793]|uniref:Kynureninase n=1 Tax=Flexibacter flexilis DSM 6793 TaxID=927664 RepID=A0A1I1EGI9_9BACT|nr:kynureninase [Flexibacter flexilis]SFB84468.1 kynureninase [Flexibacter flexilis DSM 6793]